MNKEESVLYYSGNTSIIISGYLVSFITLNFVMICEIWWELFAVTTSYTINLVAVAIVSLGCTGNDCY